MYRRAIPIRTYVAYFWCLVLYYFILDCGPCLLYIFFALPHLGSFVRPVRLPPRHVKTVLLGRHSGVRVPSLLPGTDDFIVLAFVPRCML